MLAICKTCLNKKDLETRSASNLNCCFFLHHKNLMNNAPIKALWMWSSCRKHLTAFVWKQCFIFGKKNCVQLILFWAKGNLREKSLLSEEYLSISIKHGYDFWGVMGTTEIVLVSLATLLLQSLFWVAVKNAEGGEFLNLVPCSWLPRDILPTE